MLNMSDFSRFASSGRNLLPSSHMAAAIPLELQLTAAEEEWLIRAAFGSPRGVIPPSVVGTLAAAGLGEKNSRGTIDVNDAGRQYIRIRDLPSKIDKR
jgi:hypothetical protein